MTRAGVNIQEVDAIVRGLNILSARAGAGGSAATCRRILARSAAVGKRSVDALVNPVLKTITSAKYRTGVLVGYFVKGFNGYDGAFFIQNRKSAPLNLRWCVWGRNGERLIPVQNVAPEIPPGHEVIIPFAPFSGDMQGIAALRDAGKMDDGVEDQFTGSMSIMFQTPNCYLLQQLMKVPDLRGVTTARRKQGGHNFYNAIGSGLDTALIFINPNHVFADFPGGTLTGMAAPQCSITPESARFCGDDGEEFDLAPQSPVFPLHAWESAVISTLPPWRGADGQYLAGRTGNVEYVFSGDVMGLYFYAYLGFPMGLAEMPRSFEV